MTKGFRGDPHGSARERRAMADSRFGPSRMSGGFVTTVLVTPVIDGPTGEWTLNLGEQSGEIAPVADNVTIQAIYPPPEGDNIRRLIMGDNDILVNSISFVLPGGDDINSIAGDVAQFYYDPVNARWICYSYTRGGLPARPDYNLPNASFTCDLDAQSLAYTYTSAGFGGIGDTLTFTATGEQNVKTLGRSNNTQTPVPVGMVILVNNLSINFNINGLYKCTTAGDVGVSAIWTRHIDLDTGDKFPGALVFSRDFSNLYTCNNTTPPAVGTDGIGFLFTAPFPSTIGSKDMAGWTVVTYTSSQNIAGTSFKIVIFNSASGVTCTVPTWANFCTTGSLNSSVGPVWVVGIGAGLVTLAPDTGVTLNIPASESLVLAQYQPVLIIPTTTDKYEIQYGARPPDGTSVSVNASGQMQRMALTGDISSSAGSASTVLASVITAGGPTGNTTTVPTITYDAKGRLTAVSSTTISGVSPVGSTLTSAKIWVGSGSNVAVERNMFGVVNIDNLGVTTFNSSTGGGITVVLSGTPTITSLNAGNTNITNLLDPSTAQQAATKNYVDLAVAALAPKNECQAATTAALAAATYNNGSSGVGATLTLTVAAVLILDGYTPVLNDRLLIKNQADAKQNGLFFLSQVGVLGVTQAVLTRSLDFDQPGDGINGAIVYILNGTTNGNTLWACTVAGSITFGTTNINWSQFTGGTYLADEVTLHLAGTTFSIKTTTGTGSTVAMQTSPTLITPLLGTPASGVLTNCTGTASALTAGAATVLATARTINGVSFDGSGNITVTAAAGTLTGATLAANVLASSLTSVGTLATLTVTAAIVGSVTGNAATVTTNASLTGPITSVGNATSVATTFALPGQATPAAVAGKCVYDTTQNTFLFGGGVAATPVNQWPVGVLFSATASANSTTTAQTVTLVGTGVGTMTVPANMTGVGCTLRIRARGVLTMGGTAGTVTWFVKIGSVTVASTGAQVPNTSITNRYWELDCEIVFRAVGASGSVMVQGNLSYQVNAIGVSGNMEVWPVRGNSADPPAVVTVDTTASNLVDFQVTTSNASHTIVGNMATLERLI